jgi:DNA-binding GntR family transcriptional regulator
MATQAQSRGRVDIDSGYERLRAEIVAGRLMPNQRLVEAELVAMLGVGRASIRSILARLDHDGLVVRELNRGARVRMVTADEAIEITQARAALESLAARQAAQRATDEDVAELTAILGEMPGQIESGDLLGYSETNRRLHGRILLASQHAIVQRLVDGLKAQLVRFQYRSILVPGRPSRSLAEHQALVAAIAARDPDAAEAAMRHHLSSVTDALSAAAGSAMPEAAQAVHA